MHFWPPFDVILRMAADCWETDMTRSWTFGKFVGAHQNPASPPSCAFVAVTTQSSTQPLFQMERQVGQGDAEKLSSEGPKSLSGDCAAAGTRVGDFSETARSLSPSLVWRDSPWLMLSRLGLCLAQRPDTTPERDRGI